MLLALLAIIASFANVESASTQAFPARPVRIVVGYPPGGVGDIVARLMGQWLSERLGQPFVIENRPGAASNIATEVVARAPADGYTLLLVNSANAISATFYDNLNFNFIRDIAPVATILRYRSDLHDAAEYGALGAHVKSPECAPRRAQHQEESEGSQTSGVARFSLASGQAAAGNCSTVARWPTHSHVSSTTWPSGNSSAS